MEREELLQEVQGVIEADGKKLSPSISEETINAELDDELENIGDDEESNKKVFGRIARRLLRIDGNIHSNVSREVKEYKERRKAKPAESANPSEAAPAEGAEESETLKLLKSLSQRIDDIEASRKNKAAADAKDAAVEAVKDGLRTLFKDAKVEVNEYIYRQTLRDLEIPESEDGKGINTDDLVKKMERAYYRNLKEAGLDKKDTGKPRNGNRGGGSGSSSKLDEMFKRRHPEWDKK